MEPVSRQVVNRWLAGAVCVLLLAGCGGDDRTLTLVRPPLYIDSEIAERIESLIEQEDRVTIEIIDLPDSDMSPVDAVAAGLADLAFATNIEHYRETVNVVMPIYPSVLHIVTVTEPVPDNFHALFQDKKIFAGPRGSVTREIVRDIAEDMQLGDDDFALIDDDITDVDVVMVFAPIDRRRILSDPRIAGAHLFSLGKPSDIGTGSTIDQAILLNPRLRPFVIPVGTYNEITPAPVLTVAVDTLLVARDDLDQTVVYDLFAELIRIRTAMFSERPELFQPLDKSIVNANLAFSMHPGASAFLLQDEPTFIERYSGVAEVLVTLLVGAVSGGFALINIYRIRRKNRIDRFYVEAISIRDGIGPDATEAERRAAREALLELQNEAFEQLVAERLAADESFRIFIELTNNALDRLGAGQHVNPS